MINSPKRSNSLKRTNKKFRAKNLNEKFKNTMEASTID
jgi:hypothetical protein